MTEVFKCKKLGTKCCAPKSLIKEAVEVKDDNMSIKNISILETNTVPHTTPLTTLVSKYHGNIYIVFIL